MKTRKTILTKAQTVVVCFRCNAFGNKAIRVLTGRSEKAINELINRAVERSGCENRDELFSLSGRHDWVIAMNRQQKHYYKEQVKLKLMSKDEKFKKGKKPWQYWLDEFLR